MSESTASGSRGLGRGLAVGIGCFVLLVLLVLVVGPIMYFRLHSIPEIGPGGFPDRGAISTGEGDGSTFERTTTKYGDGRVEVERKSLSAGKPTGEVLWLYLDGEGQVDPRSGLYRNEVRVRDLTEAEMRRLR